MVEAERAMLEQFGTIAWKRDGDGSVRLLLITSRDTGRWVVPRGNLIAGLPPHQSAEQEAWEEAGVTGRVGREPVGSYGYRKRRRLGRGVRARVTLFALAVDEEHADWPEAAERERRWFSPEEAAASVLEPELGALLLDFSARI